MKIKIRHDGGTTLVLSLDEARRLRNWLIREKSVTNSMAMLQRDLLSYDKETDYAQAFGAEVMPK
jgi:hypothetical protein